MLGNKINIMKSYDKKYLLQSLVEYYDKEANKIFSLNSDNS
jgi:hypothetical protein